MSKVRDSRQAAKWVGLAGSALVVGTLSVWALASPGADPLMHILAAARTELREASNFLPEDENLWRTPAGWTKFTHHIVSGDPVHGRVLIRNFGCGACHDIPGVTGARGTVGPGLRNFAARSYIAGILPNRTGNLIDWLVDPPLHNPRTAMPDMGVTASEAHDIAAYLYTLWTK